MRTRTKNILVSSAPSYYTGPYTVTVYNPDGTQSIVNQTPWTPAEIYLVYREERMDDQLGIGLPHNVIHRKQYRHMTLLDTRWPVAYAPYGESSFDGSGFTANMQYYTNHAMANTLTWDVNLNVGFPPGFNMSIPETADSAAINDLKQAARQLKADVLLNIVESNQIWPSVKSLTMSLPNMAKNWKSIRKVIKTASNGFLAWKFGVSPIISDLSKIAKYAPDMKRQFGQHRKATVQRFSKVFPMNPVYALTGQEAIYNGVTGYKRTHQGFANGPCEVRYVLVVRPRVTSYQTDAFASLDNAFSRFTTSPATLAWERIPFSFVLDWFVDVRGALNKIDKSLGVIPYDVLSLTKSTSYNVKSMTHLTLRNTASGGVLYDQQVGEVTSSHYERTVLDNPDIFPSWRNRFGKNQAGISAALIAQKLTK